MFPCGTMAAPTYIRSPLAAADTKILHARGHPLDLAKDASLEVRRQGAPIGHAQPVEPLASVPAQRIVVRDALGHEHAADAVGVLDPLRDERLPLTREPPAVLVLRAWRHDHRADPRLAALVGQQRAQQRLAVNPVALGPPLAPRDGDGGGVHNVALDAALLEPPVHREAVKASLVDGRDLDRLAEACLRFGPFSQQECEESVAIAPRDGVFGHLVAAWWQHCNQPLRLAQFE